MTCNTESLTLPRLPLALTALGFPTSFGCLVQADQLLLSSFAQSSRCTHEGNPNLIRYATYLGMHGGSTWLRYYHVFVYAAGDNVTNYMKVDLDGFQMAMD